MKLETARSPFIENPTEKQVRDLVCDDARRGEFIILSHEPEIYLQAGGENEPFCLEYREGSADGHYRAKDAWRKAEIERAFVWYLIGDSRWRTEFTWEKVQLDRPWWKFW